MVEKKESAMRAGLSVRSWPLVEDGLEQFFIGFFLRVDWIRRQHTTQLLEIQFHPNNQLLVLAAAAQILLVAFSHYQHVHPILVNFTTRRSFHYTTILVGTRGVL